MPLLIPFIIGASTTGYFWYNSKQEDKTPTFGQEMMTILTPIALIVFVLLIFRWIYLQGSKNT